MFHHLTCAAYQVCAHIYVSRQNVFTRRGKEFVTWFQGCRMISASPLPSGVLEHVLVASHLRGRLVVRCTQNQAVPAVQAQSTERRTQVCHILLAGCKCTRRKTFCQKHSTLAKTLALLTRDRASPVCVLVQQKRTRLMLDRRLLPFAQTLGFEQKQVAWLETIRFHKYMFVPFTERRRLSSVLPSPFVTGTGIRGQPTSGQPETAVWEYCIASFSIHWPVQGRIQCENRSNDFTT